MQYAVSSIQLLELTVQCISSSSDWSCWYVVEETVKTKRKTKVKLLKTKEQGDVTPETCPNTSNIEFTSTFHPTTDEFGIGSHWKLSLICSFTGVVCLLITYHL